MQKFKTTEKVKSIEINVETFENSHFILSHMSSTGETRKITVFCHTQPGINPFAGESELFAFNEKTLIHDHCKVAYEDLIKNIEKFVEENE